MGVTRARVRQSESPGRAPFSLTMRHTPPELTTPTHFSEYCSSNLHYVTRDVLQTHLQLLKEFNRLEFSSLQEWNAILDDVRQKYEGPSTKKLEAVLEKRMSKLSMEQV
ncbi:hypothetical protein Y032_0155g3085 [Ancylostoma ceylanicum]|uniref:Uncharacterized protein n=1 Tax=Ancylostoma ceylanicum TaxID=53326 RepID=A0A016SYR5_9BILA|nr:hypothetical protein Y032_0155g3085 [Ancylostoma ceylanicum]